MSAKGIGLILRMAILWIFLDIYDSIFQRCLAQPWFNVHVIQEYLDLTEPARIVEGPQDTKSIHG
uniref:Bestrophin homolog n=1 Tax=Mesocestoides corti TaxID=53468 RepID=A0A5K3EU18_MESCO